MRTRRNYVVLAVIAMTVFSFFIGTAASFAMTKGPTYGGGSVTAYDADTPLDVGSIVQLDPHNAGTVQLATQANLVNMFGVVVDPTQLLVTTSSTGMKNQTYVAVSGTYNVLVSTQGGTIAVGDYITMSSLNGIGMKASTDQKTVFGRADQSFNASSVIVGTTDIKDTSGKVTSTVKLGIIPVSINIEHNPNVKSTEQKLPPFLQRLGQQIAIKQVSPIRIYLSMAITAASIIIALVLLYAGVRSSVISIGRNPMSKKSIFKALVQVILTSILVLIIGLFAVYLLLKL